MMVMKDSCDLGPDRVFDWRRGRLKQQFLDVTGQFGPQLECRLAQQALNVDCRHIAFLTPLNFGPRSPAPSLRSHARRNVAASII
jgi:hypothetical protein